MLHHHDPLWLSPTGPATWLRRTAAPRCGDNLHPVTHRAPPHGAGAPPTGIPPSIVWRFTHG
ncbi:hypothetical protein CBM2633_A70620 [Cupriavidus taiwanensis]|nr:hypothetical protein CBM2604_A100171 [Cupriavidus taiwanensis]SOZ23881.1 hypothetical protein CBM2609_A120173 [Cupriavidus taiwanensis]SOZ44255.1 hypothetical protein CBM2610_A120173 [Cupriavidus taiwanensis]SOZ55339.1 hypothetical protein CBM2614_A220065 [Cupriavidus taiwanensis]SPA05095.1 hypothetical protein CBM2625_A180064 [Cupriavidus taiwanensis]